MIEMSHLARSLAVIANSPAAKSQPGPSFGAGLNGPSACAHVACRVAFCEASFIDVSDALHLERYKDLFRR